MKNYIAEANRQHGALEGDNMKVAFLQRILVRKRKKTPNSEKPLCFKWEVAQCNSVLFPNVFFAFLGLADPLGQPAGAGTIAAA